jgi:hypothetical protein
MHIEIKLERHIHQMRTPLGLVPVEYDQRRILGRDASDPANPWLLIGYVGTQQMAPINFVRDPQGREWPQAVKQLVRDQVAEQLGAGPRRESQPPDIQPAEPEPEQLDDEDDD